MFLLPCKSNYKSRYDNNSISFLCVAMNINETGGNYLLELLSLMEFLPKNDVVHSYEYKSIYFDVSLEGLLKVQAKM